MGTKAGSPFETFEEIIEQIQKKAASYTPEWRFGTDMPDIGSALATVYGNMLYGTAKKFQYLPYKNQIAFFNSLDAQLLPATPSEGYVTFGMVSDEVEGAEVPAGFRVIAPAMSEDGEVSFETLEDIFVTPAHIDNMLQVSGQRDFIGISNIENLQDNGVFLFDYKTENLQKHRLYFCHDDAFSITGAGRITVEFLLRGEAVPLEYTKGLKFYYSSEDGYVPFRSAGQDGNRLVFIIGKNDAPFALRTEEERESFWIMCETQDAELLDRFCFNRLLITSSNERTAPRGIYANGMDITKEDFFPFGEQLSDYSEVYFLSDEVFRKKGASVTMSFTLSFAKIPLDTNDEAAVEYDWVMKKEDFLVAPDYDVTVEEVVWEYYNGLGWTALFEKNKYGDVFTTKNGTKEQYKTMRFVCPQDMEPILINAKEGCYIRARVMKVNNLYKLRGNYISPIMDNVHFKYTYEEAPIVPQQLITENNLERETHMSGRHGFMKEFYPFGGIADDEDALYFGFDTAPIGEPIKILFDFTQQLDRKKKNLIWQYWSVKGGWRELELVDETQNLSGTGLVTMLGSSHFASKRLYGREQYWIRIIDIGESVSDEEQKNLPCLCGIYMNTVPIRQLTDIQTELFHMEVYQEDTRFELLYDHVIDIRLWVDETGSLGSEELNQLRKTGKLMPEYREDGELLRAWVEWELVDDFLSSGGMDRHFMLDANEGTIRFGNGRYGRIPPAARTDNILVNYRTGGGAHTNVPEGSISQTESYVGFISSVYNPKQLTGGQDAENLNAALKRNAAVLRHQNMAITERDFEEIAMEASRSIRRVKCFSGYDENGQKKSGAVTLVVLHEDLKQAHTRFYDIKEQVERYIREKLYNGLIEQGRFAVIAPQLVELRIRVEAAAESFDDVFRLKKQVQARLDRFLDPINGNFDGSGWDIGTLPNSLQIRNAITDIPKLLYIRNIYISTFVGEQSGMTEVDAEKIRNWKYVLPISGKHETIVHVK